MAKFAVLVSAGPDRSGSAVNGIEYARQLAADGHDVRVYLDGPATRWPDELESRADHPLSDGLAALLDGDAVVAACAFCAGAFGGTDGCRDADIELIGTPGETHGPNVSELVADGYELLTMP
jgi:hypothetical protein